MLTNMEEFMENGETTQENVNSQGPTNPSRLVKKRKFSNDYNDNANTLPKWEKMEIKELFPSIQM